MSLEGKSVLVTGGARGLGAAICRELARAGAKLIVADLNESGAKAVAESLHVPGRAVRLDVTQEGEIAVVLDRVGRLDVLVNNAAIDFTVPIEELSSAQWDAVIGVNLRAPFLLSKHAAARMKARK
jgi:NAD(P)-dependent dehydrogenase (short-subunit alcohol dehydrogenase family)